MKKLDISKYTLVEKNTIKELCFNCREVSCSGNDFCDSCGHCNCPNTPCDNCGSCECSYNVCEYCGECNCSGCVEQSDED